MLNRNHFAERAVELVPNCDVTSSGYYDRFSRRISLVDQADTDSSNTLQISVHYG